MRPEATLSSSTLTHGVILRCTDAGTDFRVNPEITKRLGIGSLISVPIFHAGMVDGALELVFAKKDAFHDQDVRTCQLMAGLVTETLTRTTEEDWRKGLAAERASMLEVLEKIKPQLARLASAPDATLAKAQPEAVDNLEKATCQQCGSELAAGDTFCVSCGTFRPSSSHGDLQSKWAALWNLKNASQAQASPPAGESVLKDPASTALPGLPAPGTAEALLAQGTGAPGSETEYAQNSSTQPGVLEASAPEESIRPSAQPPSQEPTKPEPRVWFRSLAVSPPAVQLRGFLKKSSAFARQHRGDLALAASFLLFLITIIWAVSSDHPTTSADSGNPAATAPNAPAKPKRKQAPPPPKLSMWDEFLVNIGLAEPPQAPSYSGNPNIPVWVDVHTALYYCPGSDLYGKTPQGKIASQHDAQLDQFEPASRKVCD